jgi:hypothetical protein
MSGFSQSEQCAKWLKSWDALIRRIRANGHAKRPISANQSTQVQYRKVKPLITHMKRSALIPSAESAQINAVPGRRACSDSSPIGGTIRAAYGTPG